MRRVPVLLVALMPLLVGAQTHAGDVGEGKAGEGADCFHTFKDVGATFDLSPLILGTRFNYHVKDSMDSIERNYTYVFNICSNVGHVPEFCDPTPAPAYQVSEENAQCFRLANDPTDAEWALIDPANPTTGISMTYKGGDQCGNSNKDRSLKISMLCSTEEGMSEFDSERVIEDHCEYSMTVNTLFGCPLECPVGANRQLCTGHGFCGMDDDHNKPQCFCYSGWYGDACEIQADTGELGAFGVLLIVVILLRGGLLAAGGYVYTKVRKLRRRKLYQMQDQDEHDSATVFSIEDDGDL
jgi:hypothetical protein